MRPCECMSELTSWVQKETPVERLFSRGRLRSRMERPWDLSSPSFSSSLLSNSVQWGRYYNVNNMKNKGFYAEKPDAAILYGKRNPLQGSGWSNKLMDLHQENHLAPVHRERGRKKRDKRFLDGAQTKPAVFPSCYSRPLVFPGTLPNIKGRGKEPLILK